MEVIYNNKTFFLTQDAYITGLPDCPHYTAAGIDERGKEYMIIWKILEEYLSDDGVCDANDEDVCDWEHPVMVYDI